MELILDEGRVYGARYHTVMPVGYALGSWDQMVDWCCNTYGPTPKDGVWSPGARWYINNSKFWFREERARTLFILRWA